MQSDKINGFEISQKGDKYNELPLTERKIRGFHKFVYILPNLLTLNKGAILGEGVQAI